VGKVVLFNPFDPSYLAPPPGDATQPAKPRRGKPNTNRATPNRSHSNTCKFRWNGSPLPPGLTSAHLPRSLQRPACIVQQ
jgi:hypothetical protein